MATPEENRLKLQEISNRGIADKLSPDQRARFDEAVRRKIITAPGQSSVINEPVPENKAGFGERLLGSGEAALTFATGMPAQVAGGIGGLYEVVSGLVSGKSNVIDSAANRVRSISESMTYQPRGQSGQDILEMVGIPFQEIEKVTRGAGNIALDITGSPALATAVKTGLEMAPAAIFGRGGKSLSDRRADISRETKALEGIGVDINKSVESQRASVQDMAARSSQGQQIRAQEMATVQRAVQTAEKVAQANVDNLYGAARQTNASVPSQALSGLPSSTRAALADYDIDLMPIAQRRLSELDKINSIPGGYAVKLNELEKYRRRINRNKPSSNDLSQQAALGIIKGQVDATLDAAFNSNMIKGDPAAVQAWRDARGAFIEYKKTFDEDKVINQLASQKATPEEIRNWIFGASAVGAKKEAGRVIGSLKGILGEDSPAFGALRQEALFDVMEPLLREVPDYQGYVNNYDKFVRNSPSVAKELFPDSMEDLQKLRGYASAANKISPQGLSFDIEQTASRAFLGHGIAKAAMKVSLASQALKMIRAATGKTEKQRILSEILGYDTTQPLIPLSPVAAASAIQTGINEGAQ